MLDLVLPLECGGCGAPLDPLVRRPAPRRWRSTSDEPISSPRGSTPACPVFALGRYAGPRRQAIVALKEHGRRDLVAPLARALALGVHRLIGWGILDTPVTVVPAPTRRVGRPPPRWRPGHPDRRRRDAGPPGHPVVPALRTGPWSATRWD